MSLANANAEQGNGPKQNAWVGSAGAAGYDLRSELTYEVLNQMREAEGKRERRRYDDNTHSLHAYCYSELHTV